MVVGCGKVGSTLATVLSRQGHDISVLDGVESNFDLLGHDFSGMTTYGIPIDQDVLRKAGIESCDALAAVSQDDNINIMVSQLAREIFKVPKVLTRIYDPKRRDVFSHFGLHTVCPTNLTVSAICSALTSREEKTVNFGSHTVSFTTLSVPKSYVGATAKSIELEENESLFAIEHEDFSLTLYNPGDAYKLQKNDKLVFSRIVD